MPTSMLEQSCNIAFAALLHDLGKLSERAKIDVAQQTLESNKHLYCPFHRDGGYFSHIHAAYSAISIDLIEDFLPNLKGQDASPFGGWQNSAGGSNDDSLINGAAMHHRPHTALQWIIATADRLSAGFEREEFAEYNKSKERNHYQARLLSLFEQINTSDNGNQTKGDRTEYRYKLSPMSADSVFPVKATDYETSDNKTAQSEYRQLWEAFLDGVRQIPGDHRRNLPMWLDHLDSLYLNFCHSVPSATAFGTRPDVSLYDHSKAVAAIAVALWRYYEENDINEEAIVSNLKRGTDRQTEKFLLIQGDFTGIQKFVFSSGGETDKQAAKTLRGRSMYVSFINECAALKVLEALSLPSTSQIINAAGKFLIVAPNTADTRQRLTQLQSEFDDWFIENTYGVSGLVLASTPASSRNFMRGNAGGASPFGSLLQKLSSDLEEKKLQRFDLCGNDARDAVRTSFLDALDNNMGLCALDGRYAATRELVEGIFVSDISHDQAMIGEYITRTDHVIVANSAYGRHSTIVPIFGYTLSFTDNDGARAADTAGATRVYDLSLPVDGTTQLWNGVSRRNVNSYIPRFQEGEISDNPRYEEIDNEELSSLNEGSAKTFSHLACEDRVVGSDGTISGITALSVVKGDVDNLGMIFQRGLSRPTFAKMSGLSRQLDAFFTVHLPYLCSARHPNTYTVFAGGDDFMLVGPWRSQMRLLEDLKKDFERFVVNPGIHFSAGITTAKPKTPVRSLSNTSEAALEASKHASSAKNAVTCYGQTVSWQSWHILMQVETAMEELRSRYGLSAGYIYGLIELAEQAAAVEDNPENAIWLSRFVYRSKRFVDDNLNSADHAKKSRVVEELMTIANAIKEHGEAFKIPLFNHLYTLR